MFAPSRPWRPVRGSVRDDIATIPDHPHLDGFIITESFEYYETIHTYYETIHTFVEDAFCRRICLQTGEVA